MPTDTELIQKIDAILPQTQCQACGYKDCLAYATAVTKHGAETNLCQPGGTSVHQNISQLASKTSPAPQHKQPLFALKIESARCIGCTKCLNACPVDAIFGTQGQLHDIITDRCTGCNLCIEPCPTDCIIPSNQPINHEATSAELNRQRYLNKQKRLANEKKRKKSQHQLAKRSRTSYAKTQSARLEYIQDILETEND